METNPETTPATEPRIITKRGYEFTLHATGCYSSLPPYYPFVLRRAATDKTPEMARYCGSEAQAEGWADLVASVYPALPGYEDDAYRFAHEADQARQDAFFACHPAD